MEWVAAFVWNWWQLWTGIRSLRTAQKLGHNSIASQGAYIRDIKRRTQGSSVHKLTDELTAERDKNDRFAIDIAELKRKLDMVEHSYRR
jgi:hypothetical protein